jgi:hypothetical protein
VFFGPCARPLYVFRLDDDKSWDLLGILKEFAIILKEIIVLFTLGFDFLNSLADKMFWVGVSIINKFWG